MKLALFAMFALFVISVAVVVADEMINSVASTTDVQVQPESTPATSISAESAIINEDTNSQNTIATKNDASMEEPKPTTHWCPSDDTLVTSSITLGPDICNVDDIDNNGVFIISASNIVLDCNGLTLIGANRGIGIYLGDYRDVTIKNCNVQGYWSGGIRARSPASFGNNKIINNTNPGFAGGIIVEYNANALIEDNSVGSTIRVYYSDNTIVRNNTINSGVYGIELSYSKTATLKNNKMNQNYRNFFIQGFEHPEFNHDIDTSNTVDGKPIYYIRNQNSQTYGPSTNAGFFACIRCNDVIAEGLTLSKNSYGALFFETNNSAIRNSNILQNNIGVWIYEWVGTESSGNVVYGNKIADNTLGGVGVRYVDRTTVENNLIDNNVNWGVKIESSDNIVKGNAITRTKDYSAFSPSTALTVGSGIVFNNTVENNDKYAVVLTDSNNISNNIIRNNGGHGISATSIPDSTIENNVITQNSGRGIFLNGQTFMFSYNNRIMNNNITQNTGEGIRLTFSPTTKVENNLIKLNTEGVYIDSSDNSSLKQNFIYQNAVHGIYIYNSKFNDIANNTACQNLVGVELDWFPQDNYMFGNNIIDNQIQAFEDGNSNFWSFQNYGNYWNDYTGTDSNADGIGDTPYLIDVDSQDSYPLMQLNPNAPLCGATQNQPPVALFTAVPNTGVAPLLVNFDASASYDPDGIITSYMWEFGDGFFGSGVTTSHTYNGPATYTVTLTVTDDNNAIDTEQITIVVTATNQLPIADAGLDQIVFVNSIVNLNGQGTDPDGFITLYEWDFEGDGVFDWSSTTTGVTTHVYTVIGDYFATLRVTDNDGAWREDFAIINVTVPSPDDQPPYVSKVFPNIVIENEEVVFHVEATDNIGVASCNFYWEGALVGPMTNSNQNIWDIFFTTPSEGNYKAYGNCTDTSGNWNYNETLIEVRKCEYVEPQFKKLFKEPRPCNT